MTTAEPEFTFRACGCPRRYHLVDVRLKRPAWPAAMAAIPYVLFRFAWPVPTPYSPLEALVGQRVFKDIVFKDGRG